MSVYTIIEHQELEDFLRNYSLGELINYEGINAGIENTNYFLSTENGEFVLTIFEEISFEVLPYYLSLMAHLSDHGMPTAHPIADLSGDYIRTLKNKPAAIVRRLEGDNVLHPTAEHCAAVGHALARMHTVGESFQGQHKNPRGAGWAEFIADKMMDKLGNDEKVLLQEEIEFRKIFPDCELPIGVIHADLFRDNVMFKGHSLTGMIDFYYACNDHLLYDVAITVNDWCSNKENGDLKMDLYQSFMEAYQSIRKFNSSEEHAWQYMMRAAALRFWLSRLKDKLFPKDGEIVHIKEPNVFKNILLSRINEVPSLIL